MIVPRKAKDTLTAVELFTKDVLEFTLLDGTVRRITVLDTGAEIMETTLEELKVEVNAAVTTYRFWCDIGVDGETHRLEREVGTQKSFYEPWEIAGIRLWLDAVDDIFDFVLETHGFCRLGESRSAHQPPRMNVRFALQDASARICPETLHPWCPLPNGGLKIEMCYRGEDCWMGAYNGASAHAGLDINHPAGTPLWAPIDLDTHYLYNRVEHGYNNNRWIGTRRWENGAEWILMAAHMIDLTAPEHRPLAKGTKYANGAGVCSGAAEHSHFIFRIYDYGTIIPLDAWILFWQMYRDRESATSS
jgi:hypothetical protein